MNKTLWLIASLLASTIALGAPDTDRVALEAAMNRWTMAVNARDEQALRATMTEDVELSDHTGTVNGRDAAIRALLEVAKRGQLVATSREIMIADPFAWRTGWLVQNEKNGTLHARGQTLEIWVSAPSFNTKVARITFKKGKQPVLVPYCVLPGSSKVQKTCS